MQELFETDFGQQLKKSVRKTKRYYDGQAIYEVVDKSISEMCIRDRYNGGDTIDATFRIDKVSSDIHSFYGFSLAKYYSNFNYLIEKGFLEDFIDNYYLPIAKDSFGNSILIGIDARNYNKIAFYDHEKQKYISFNIDFIEFLKKIKSPVVYIPSIEERIKEMEEIGSTIVVDDELKALWQEEIDEFAGREQVIVKL